MNDATAIEIESFDPRTGVVNGAVPTTSLDKGYAKVAAAAAVANDVASRAPSVRAAWLEAVAAALDADKNAIIEVASRETGLSAERLAIELRGAIAQWRFYAGVTREGSWLGATIDHATEHAADLRRVGTSLGPVAVFGASNFPLGFGMLGHDTAAAIASGSPVVVKAHPAHALLSEHLAALAVRALSDAGAPMGTFQVVRGFEAGSRIVLDPRIRAVAFTGSQAGGLALVELSRRREVPVPVFAEMGTVNPVVFTPASGRRDMAPLAQGFVASIRFGAGQVCTKPGMVFVPRGSGFADAVDTLVRMSEPVGWALTESIAHGYAAGIRRFVDAGAQLVGSAPAHPEGWAFETTVLSVPIQSLKRGSPFLAECFGPVGLIVEYDELEETIAALGEMQGALTASVFVGEDDPDTAALVSALAEKVGRVVVDQWPSGVATNWAQHHGGPWPSTSDPTATSVGAAAVTRFVRPIAYQNVPDLSLPMPLQERNPWGIPRRVDGEHVPA